MVHSDPINRPAATGLVFIVGLHTNTDSPLWPLYHMIWLSSDCQKQFIFYSMIYIEWKPWTAMWRKKVKVEEKSRFFSAKKKKKILLIFFSSIGNTKKREPNKSPEPKHEKLCLREKWFWRKTNEFGNEKKTWGPEETLVLFFMFCTLTLFFTLRFRP